MSGACHSVRPGGERSDDNDFMSRENSPEAEIQVSSVLVEENDNQEENINWHASSFYIGKFFIKQPDSKAKCSTCKDVIKTKLGNTTGLDGHLMRKHPKVYELYKSKKAEVDSKRAELKVRLNNNRKRKNSEDVIKSKQIKLEFKSGVLNMKPPPPNPQVQIEYVDEIQRKITRK